MLYSFATCLAASTAALFLWYSIATLAPASARASAIARPRPLPAPETMAVLPVRENCGNMRDAILLSMGNLCTLEMNL